jgi:hypothetical protein
LPTFWGGYLKTTRGYFHTVSTTAAPRTRARAGRRRSARRATTARYCKNRHGDSSSGRGGAPPGGDSRTFWQVRDPTIVGAIDPSNFGEKDVHGGVLFNKCTVYQIYDPHSGAQHVACTSQPPSHNSNLPHPQPHRSHKEASRACIQHLYTRLPTTHSGLAVLRAVLHATCAALQLRPPQGVIPPSGVSASREHPKNSRGTSIEQP